VELAGAEGGIPPAPPLLQLLLRIGQPGEQEKVMFGQPFILCFSLKNYRPRVFELYLVHARVLVVVELQ